MSVQCEVIGDCTLYCGEALEVLPTLGLVDAVVTDPPYLVGSASTRTSTKRRSRLGDWSNAAFVFAAWMEACWKAMPEHGSLWMCGNWRSLPVVTMAADTFGGTMASVIVWDKNWIGVGSLKGLRQRYELMFQFGKPGFAIPDRSEPDIWVIPWASQRPSGHESEKPVGLMHRAISWTCGHIIVDPFMGSGTTGVAAVQLGRAFIGIELDPYWWTVACRRIEHAYARPDCFVAPASKAEQLALGVA